VGSLASELDAVMSEVKSVEWRLCEQGGAAVTLLSVAAHLAASLAQLRLLDGLVRAVLPPNTITTNPDNANSNNSNGNGGGRAVTPDDSAATAARVLSSLYSAMCTSHLDSSSLGARDKVGGGRGMFCTALRLWVGALQPYLLALDAWMGEGELEDPDSEFLVQSHPEVLIADPHYWRAAFALRRARSSPPATERHPAGGAGLVVCPSFLEEVATEVLATGKSLRLLQNVRSSDSEPADDVGRAPPLHAQFLTQLKAAVPWFKYQDADGELSDENRHPGRAAVQSGSSKPSAHFQGTTVDPEHDSLEHRPERAQGALPIYSKSARWPSAGAMLMGSMRASGGDARAVLRRVLPQGTQVAPFLKSSARSTLPLSSSHETLFEDCVSALPVGRDYYAGTIGVDTVDPVLSVPPPQVLVERCLVGPIRERAGKVSAQLLRRLHSSWGLTRELTALRDVFLGGKADALALFSEEVFRRLARGDCCTDVMELSLLLEESLCGSSPLAGSLTVIAGGQTAASRSAAHDDVDDQDQDDEYIPDASFERQATGSVELGTNGNNNSTHVKSALDALDSGDSASFEGVRVDSQQNSHSDGVTKGGLVVLDQKAWRVAARERVQGEQRRRDHHLPEANIHTLSTLKLGYELPWPLQMVVDAPALDEYNSILSFLLTLRRTKFALDRVPRLAPNALLHMELHHFVTNLQQYCLDGVLLGAASGMHEALVAANTLDEVIDAHKAYLKTAKDRCFLTPSLLTKSLAARIFKILSLVLQYARLCRDQAAAPAHASRAMEPEEADAQFRQIEHDFRASNNFLLRVLTSQLRVTHQEHLQHLVMRLNYNEFYFSASEELAFQAPAGGSYNAVSS